MKIASALLLVTFVTSAHAQLLVPQGAKGQLKIEYVFTSSGNITVPGERIDKWNVRRVVSMTAQYEADAPLPIGVMHTSDPKQQAEIAGVQARTMSAQKKLQPMGNDMMAIAASCGITMDGPAPSAAQEKEQEACVEKAVTGYASNKDMTPVMKSAGADIAAVNKAMSGTRFQLWRLTSQTGTYSFDEEQHRQVFEMTCTTTKVCKRDDIIKGGGALPAPPDGKSIAGYSTLEVDSVGKDLVLGLPRPLSLLGFTQTVTTTIVDEEGFTKQGGAPSWTPSGPLTVSIPGSLATLSGTKTIRVEGKGAEGGTITVNWQFTRK